MPCRVDIVYGGNLGFESIGPLGPVVYDLRGFYGVAVVAVLVVGLLGYLVEGRNLAGFK